MKKYSLESIDHFTRFVLGDTASFNWLMNNGYKEFFATLDAIRDEKRAFQYLMDNKHVVLAAFVNAVWDDEKAFAFLMKAKAFEWAAMANIINGDEKAEDFLKKIKKENYILLAHAIQSRIHQDGDYNVSPIGALKNMLNFKKAFKKE
ncbi:hypothetical protein [Aurantibacillus circumpalustris]|uniref:hypothetical protein n=1 Tax=Aurantibacillus circumpalustris TaxID=3036359 RepID=UPI00295B32A2|nr:hypothetical protein [Aurantibacillus circumpalustris]